MLGWGELETETLSCDIWWGTIPKIRRFELAPLVTIILLVFVFLFLVSLPFSNYILELLRTLTRFMDRGLP